LHCINLFFLFLLEPAVNRSSRKHVGTAKFLEDYRRRLPAAFTELAEIVAYYLTDSKDRSLIEYLGK